MFYSQIILAKKGPLGKVWLAAHWGDKKIGRTQIFTTDISQSVQDIVNPAAPLSLRVSGHLLLGVVRIYSRKVKYLKNDVEEAAVKMKMTFKGGAGSTKDSGETDFMVVDLNPNRSPRKSKSMGVNNVVNFGEYDGGDFLSTELSNRTSILDNPLNLPGVQPVSNDQLLIPFTLDPGDGGDLGFQEWEAVQEEGDLGDPLRQIQPF
jgi:cohesin complex subunit SCC1